MGNNLNNFFYQLLFNIIINIIIVEYVIIIIGHLSKTNIAQCNSHWNSLKTSSEWNQRGMTGQISWNSWHQFLIIIYLLIISALFTKVNSS